MKKIKVLRIIARLNIGGPSIHSILLTEGLNCDKFESILVTGKVYRNEGDMAYLAEEKRVKPIIIPELGRPIHLIKDLITLYKIYCLILRKKPDIVHTHTAKAGVLGRMAGLVYNMFGFKKRVKLIHTFHGHVLEGYFSTIQSKVFIWIERTLAKITDKIIVVSESLKNDLLNLGIGDKKKIDIISLGLDLEKLLNVPEPTHLNSTVKIGIIGRLVPIKNHRMFLEVAKSIRNNGNINVNFFIIGDGELRAELERYTKELDLGSEVTFMGWQRDLENIYQDLDIVALTSLNEGTPVSLIEAMAAARSVIATDVGGIKDLIGDNERGVLIRTGDVNAFSQGLIRLLKDTALRNKINKQARDFVKDRFSKERLINDMEGLYNCILKRN